MILYIVALILALGFAVTSISGAPWVPVRAYDVDALLDDTKLAAGDTYLELGCGDGRLVQAAARRGIVATGYELNPVLWFIAWLRCAKYRNAHVQFGNFWSVDLGKTDVVMAFLVPRTMPRLGRKAEAEMKKSSRLISYIFPIPGKKHAHKHKSWYVYSFS